MSSKDIFKNYAVKVVIKVQKGSHVLITDNFAESEMILPRGQNYRIISARQNEKKQVELTLEFMEAEK